MIQYQKNFVQNLNRLICHYKSDFIFQKSGRNVTMMTSLLQEQFFL